MSRPSRLAIARNARRGDQRRIHKVARSQRNACGLKLPGDGLSGSAERHYVSGAQLDAVQPLRKSLKGGRNLGAIPAAISAITCVATLCAPVDTRA